MHIYYNVIPAISLFSPIHLYLNAGFQKTNDMCWNPRSPIPKSSPSTTLLPSPFPLARQNFAWVELCVGGHNVNFFIAQQSGGWCDCGDEETWRRPIQCPHQDHKTRKMLLHVPYSRLSPMILPPAPNYSFCVNVPADSMDSMRTKIAFALDFMLDTLDHSPDEPFVPANEANLANLRLQPSADPMMKDQCELGGRW